MRPQEAVLVHLKQAVGLWTSTSGPPYWAPVSSSSQPDKRDQALCSDRHFQVADAVGPECRCRLSGSVDILMKQEDLKAEPRSGKSISVHLRRVYFSANKFISLLLIPCLCWMIETNLMLIRRQILPSSN